MSDSLNRMSCEAAFRRLDDFLDRHLSAEEMRLVEEHLRICEACTREFTFEASVLTGVKRKLKGIDAPADLLARISAQLDRLKDESEDQR
jgi:anti-sigma factor (TIGR02949 family)